VIELVSLRRVEQLLLGNARSPAIAGFVARLSVNVLSSDLRGTAACRRRRLASSATPPRPLAGSVEVGGSTSPHERPGVTDLCLSPIAGQSVIISWSCGRSRSLAAPRAPTRCHAPPEVQDQKTCQRIHRQTNQTDRSCPLVLAACCRSCHPWVTCGAHSAAPTPDRGAPSAHAAPGPPVHETPKRPALPFVAINDARADAFTLELTQISGLVVVLWSKASLASTKNSSFRDRASFAHGTARRGLRTGAASHRSGVYVPQKRFGFWQSPGTHAPFRRSATTSRSCGAGARCRCRRRRCRGFGRAGSFGHEDARRSVLGLGVTDTTGLPERGRGAAACAQTG